MSAVFDSCQSLEYFNSFRIISYQTEIKSCYYKACTFSSLVTLQITRSNEEKLVFGPGQPTPYNRVPVLDVHCWFTETKTDKGIVSIGHNINGFIIGQTITTPATMLDASYGVRFASRVDPELNDTKNSTAENWSLKEFRIV